MCVCSIQGIYTGGLPSCLGMIRAGLAAPTDFSLMLGMSGWQPGQLEEEVRAGYWHVLAASSTLALPHRACE